MCLLGLNVLTWVSHSALTTTPGLCSIYYISPYTIASQQDRVRDKLFTTKDTMHVVPSLEAWFNEK